MQLNQNGFFILTALQFYMGIIFFVTLCVSFLKKSTNAEKSRD